MVPLSVNSFIGNCAAHALRTIHSRGRQNLRASPAGCAAHGWRVHGPLHALANAPQENAHAHGQETHGHAWEEHAHACGAQHAVDPDEAPAIACLESAGVNGEQALGVSCVPGLAWGCWVTGGSAGHCQHSSHQAPAGLAPCFSCPDWTP